MSKRHLESGNPLPPAKRLHAPGVHRRLHVCFDSLYDELILCIFSHLSFADLCVAQAINKNCQRLATDIELWRNLYLKTFGRSRLRGYKGPVGVTRADGREVLPLPARVSPKQDHFKDWKWMFRISSNWRKGRFVHFNINFRSIHPSSKGRCAIDELAAPAQGPSFTRESDPFRTHVLLAGNLTITASSRITNTPTIHIFDRRLINHSLACESHFRGRMITALAIDQAPASQNELRLATFLSTGEFFVFSVYPDKLAASSQILSYRPRRAEDMNVVEAVYHHPLLVTLSPDFKLSIYDLSGNTAKRTQTLSSFTSFPPTSIVLSTPTLDTYKLVIAYAIPVYPAHWSVGATELMISRLSSYSMASSLVPSPSLIDPFTVVSARTTRALDVPQGWIDENKLGIMREQWSRKLSQVADTQTDGKWIVLAPGDDMAMPTSASGSSEDEVDSVGTWQPTSSTPLQLYRLYLPSSNSVAGSPPKMTFVRTLDGQTGPISSVSLSDGRCVSLGVDGRLWVWDLEAGTGSEVSAGSRRESGVGEKSVVVFDEKQIVTTSAGRIVIRRFDV